jgi:hypothetical protein
VRHTRSRSASHSRRTAKSARTAARVGLVRDDDVGVDGAWLGDVTNDDGVTGVVDREGGDHDAALEDLVTVDRPGEPLEEVRTRANASVELGQGVRVEEDDAHGALLAQRPQGSSAAFERHGTSPCLHGAMPCLHGTTPGLHETTCRVNKAMPCLNKATCRVNKAMPCLNKATCRVNKAMPCPNEATCRVKKAMPCLNKATCRVNEAMCCSNKATCRLNMAMSCSNKATCRVNNAMPCPNKATYRVNEAMPCPNKATCRVNKASCRHDG